MEDVLQTRGRSINSEAANEGDGGRLFKQAAIVAKEISRARSFHTPPPTSCFSPVVKRGGSPVPPFSAKVTASRGNVSASVSLLLAGVRLLCHTRP